VRILYSNTLLCSSNPAQRLGPVDPALNGQPVIDVWQAFGADYHTVYGRGDGPVEFSFGVHAKFSTEAEVVAFVTTHRETLPVQAELIITDDAETVAFAMANAVRRVAFSAIIGTSVLIQYQFTGSRFQTEDVPAAPTDVETVKTLEIALDPDDEEKEITFTTPFAATPKFIRGEICGPASTDGGVAIEAKPINPTRSAEGCTFEFTQKIPAEGYSLLVFAAL
jgi:hypothetical protein